MSRDHGDWLVYDRADAARPELAQRLNPSSVISNVGRSGPSAGPRSGGDVAAPRAFIERFAPALTFRAGIACRQLDRWWEIAFELLSKRLRNLGSHDRRRTNSVVQSLIDDLLRLVAAERFPGVTHQMRRGTKGVPLQSDIGVVDRHLPEVSWFVQASDNDITNWPGSRLLPMR